MNFKMNVTTCLCCLFAVVGLSGCGRGYEDSIPAYEFEQYSLFTWNTGSGDFCFKIMTGAESNKFIHTWFPKRNARCGIAELKKALTELPSGSRVFWEDWPPQGFNYPPENVIKEVIEFANGKGIHLEQSPSVH